jgi:hypothetical protein
MLLVIEPAEPIITATDAKVRVPALVDEADAVVNVQIAVATIAAENYIEKAIGVQTLEWRPELSESAYTIFGRRFFNRWVMLPKHPLASNELTFKYLDTSGVEQTWDAANYMIAGVGGKGKIYLTPTSSWPGIGQYPEPIRIQYVAGFDPIPEPIMEAILIATSDGVSSIGGSGSDNVRSVSVEGSGTVSYGSAGSSGAAFAATTGDKQLGVLSKASRALLDPYRDF